MMLERIFHNLGVDEKEAKIYLAALEVGSSPVSVIAAKARMNRVTAYGILDKLVRRGMVNFMTRHKVKYFHATDPDLLLVDYQKHIRDLEKALPDLKRLYGVTPHPKVKSFEGAEGIRKIYLDTLTAQTEILNFCNSGEIRAFWLEYDREYVEERVGRKIYLRGIAPGDKYGRKVHSQDSLMHREIRLIPKDKYDFSNDVNVYDDKVAIVSFQHEPIGMIIENAEIANTQRAIFEMVWDFSRDFF